LWLGLGVGVVVIIAIGGWLFLSRQAGPPPPPEPQEAERRIIQAPAQEFQVTLTIPEDESGRPAAWGTTRVSGLIEDEPLGRKTISLAEVEDVPGLSVYPIPGTDLQVYRIVRPINLGLDPAAEVILARAEGRPAEPAASPEPAKPKKPGLIVRINRVWINEVISVQARCKRRRENVPVDGL